jgi:two-component system cell cycle response regulator DivK
MSVARIITAKTVVLLVQPERDDRDMYAEFLRHEGLIAIVMPEAGPALRVAPNAHIVVTELLLTGFMEGVEFIRRLRHDDATKHIPLIVLTSSAWNTERDRAMRAGCDLFLVKPYLPNDLVSQIRRLVSLAHIGTARRRPVKAGLRPARQVRRKS